MALQPDISPTEKPTEKASAGRDLGDAISACFDLDIVTPPFANRLVELTAALTNSSAVSVWRSDEEQRWIMLARSERANPDPDLPVLIDAQRAKEDTKPVSFGDGRIFASVALSDGSDAVLVAILPAGGAVAHGLAYERITLLANLSFAKFRHPDLESQQKLVQSVLAVADGHPDSLQNLTDQIAKLTGADVVSAGLYDGQSITEMAIAGQEGFAKRAQLPKQMRDGLTETAKLRLLSQEKVFAVLPGSDKGLALLLDGARRNPSALPIAAGVYTQARHRKAASKWTAKRLVKLGSAALILIGLAMIPIPDGVDLPARVEASNKRIMTAPFTGILTEVAVKENEAVAQGQLIARLDVQETDLELLGVIAERSNAIIERESARASRNAALLRNAEIEVERLQTRIDLLEARKASAVLKSALDGVAILGDLKSRVGSTVRQGEPLLEVTDPSQLYLELSIVETEVGRVTEGEKGTFRPDFDPSLTFAAELEFISPAIDTTQQTPVVPAQAQLSEQTTGLTPGLSGVLLVNEKYSPIWQVFYRNLRNWLLLKFLI